MSSYRVYEIEPCSKPRMTQRDKWKKRPAVAKYWQYRDVVKLNKVCVPLGGAHVEFHISMPKSWSRKKREESNGKPHQQRPDCDNLLKALLDAVYDEDCQVWDVRVTKYWAYSGKTIIKGE